MLNVRVPCELYDTTLESDYDWFVMEIRQFQFGPRRHMSTPAKIAAIVFGIVLFLPIFALVLIAGLLAGIVFSVLFLFSLCKRKLRSLASGKDTDGRKNVRVKR